MVITGYGYSRSQGVAAGQRRHRWRRYAGTRARLSAYSRNITNPLKYKPAHQWTRTPTPLRAADFKSGRKAFWGVSRRLRYVFKILNSLHSGLLASHGVHLHRAWFGTIVAPWNRTLGGYGPRRSAVGGGAGYCWCWAHFRVLEPGKAGVQVAHQLAAGLF